ncbi:MAG TPA: TlpA disulfide reductase family protein [Pirellulales bacterium]|nr:TlpA disulfide reductase family protein [Pirellulales bacterium]
MIQLWPVRRRIVSSFAAAALLAFSPAPQATLGQKANDDRLAEAAEKMSDTWSRIVPVSDPPDAKFGDWRMSVQEGWLVVERRTGDDKVEWKIVLAKVVGDEPPEIVVSRMPQGARMVQNRRDAKGVQTATAVPGPTGPIPGTLRLSYRDGRYFIRDGFSSLRCLRQPKASNATWPRLDVPPRDAKGPSGMAGGRTGVVSAQASDSWITVAAGARGGPGGVVAADCLVRLTHTDLRGAGSLGFTGGEISRVTSGEWFVLDDGDLLVAEKLDAWRLPGALQAQAQRDPALAARLATEKLGGSPAPELSGQTWLNADRGPTWQELRGKPVLLVLFDLKQPPFVPLVPPLLAFAQMYGKQGLAIVGVHANGPRDEIEKRLAEQQIAFPVLIDDGKTTERYGIGYSACLLIDREGKVVSVYKDSLAPPAEIEKLLEAK